MWDINFYLEPLFWLISLLFILQLFIYLFLFRRVAVHKPDCSPGNDHFPVTVVITAKDEATNLAANLPKILGQDHAEFEVIVVDDQSEDGTQDLLLELSSQYPALKVITIEQHINDFKGKKLALTLAFKSARYETLLLTDADCEPMSDQWLKLMAAGYKEPETEFVIGYSPYKKYGGMLNRIIRYETFYTALQYFSFALGGRAYMGVGRNLSYRKALFFSKKGFSPYLKVAAGDDDLFVNMHSTKINTKIQLCPDSFTLSEPKRSWSTWIQQKRRHSSVSKYYKASDKRKLGGIWLANFLFYLSIVAGCIYPGLLFPTLGILFLRIILQCVIFGMAGRRLYSKNLWIGAPILDLLFQLFILPWLGLVSIFSKKKEW
jgi:biofilm PGA synthesis N-glycosyltransferase PgaC